ncbi:ferredoxin family protein [Caulobacter sp. 1776]|uniref:4Fe-4S dicluster domain-containing protein n=1 Tax=Caulobacter sp. 1776 TaxID=3156420 RepID=UPI003390B8C7
MIEVVVEDRCNGCGDCVQACPSDVLRMGADGRAVIAHQADCQTCLLCELYCTTDALFVWPQVDRVVGLSAEQALASGQLGAFRRDHGWGEHTTTHTNQHWRMGAIFERARLLAVETAAAKTARPEDIR